MAENSKVNPVIANVRRSLGRKPEATIPPRPPVLPPRPSGDINIEIELFIEEVQKLSGKAKQIEYHEFADALRTSVREEQITKACAWQTPGLASLDIAGILQGSGVEVIPADSDKYSIAACDLGITEADFALPETGTIGLRSNRVQPRSVSLLPRVHLAIIFPGNFRADLHDVLEESALDQYLVLITGPSRTADIELTVALGVHGPKSLHAWILPERFDQ